MHVFSHKFQGGVMGNERKENVGELQHLLLFLVELSTHSTYKKAQRNGLGMKEIEFLESNNVILNI